MRVILFSMLILALYFADSEVQIIFCYICHYGLVSSSKQSKRRWFLHHVLFGSLFPKIIL